jgi:ribosome-associated toxin RatA of RatAB toxin-antitoxin module
VIYLSIALLVVSLSSGDEARLVKGDVLLAVARDQGGASGNVDAWIDIPAPPSLVWMTMNDCDNAPSFVPNLVCCKLIERDPGGAWEVREHVANPGWLLPNVRSRFRADLVADKEIRFSQIDGDFEIMEGRWSLSPIGSEGTRLRYQARLQPRMWVPDFVVRQTIETDAPNTLRALRAEVLRRLAQD